MQDLLARQGMSSATELLLTGDLSGAYGRLPDANDLLPPGIRTVIAADGGFLQDIGGYDANAIKTNYVIIAGAAPIAALWGTGRAFWGGRGDRIGDAAADKVLERARCYIARLVLRDGTIPPPVLVANAPDDTAQLTVDGMTSKDPAPGSPEAVYATVFARGMTDLLLASGLYTGTFSPDAFEHQLFGSAQIFNQPFEVLGPLEVSTHRAVGAWYLNPCAGEKWIGASRQ